MSATFGKCCCKNILRIRYAPVYRNFHRTCVTAEHTQSQDDTTPPPPTGTKFVIPKRIKRDKLTILKALESTVKRDFGSPHYQFIDDPGLIPLAQVESRACLHSKVSGQKAAEYVIRQHPELFLHDDAHPSIPAFNVTKVKYEPDTLKGLKEQIDLRRPVEAFDSYKSVQQAGVKISVDMVEDLLDLLCVYNNTDPPKQLHPESLQLEMLSKEVKDVTWRPTCNAETVFEEMDEKTPAAYNSLIRGRSKFQDFVGYNQLYQEARQQEIPLDIETYNQIISTSTNPKGNAESRYNTGLGYMRDMAASGIIPTVRTFDSLLTVIQYNSRHEKAREWTMELLNEMKHLDIVPSLSTWNIIIRIFYRHSTSQSDILIDIMPEIADQEFTFQFPEDLQFFSNAMNYAVKNMDDLDVAYAIDKLLNTGDNMLLMCRTMSESRYYSLFLQIVSAYEPFDKVMACYEHITPHVFKPTYPAMIEMLEALDLNDGFKYIPQIWADLQIFGGLRRPDIMEKMFEIMKQVTDPKMLEQFMEMLGSYFEDIEIIVGEVKASTSYVTKRINAVNGLILGEMVDIALAAGHDDKAWSYFELYHDNLNMIQKIPSDECMITLTEKYVEAKDMAKTMKCLLVMSNGVYPKTEELVTKVKETMNPDEDTIVLLDSFL